LEEERKIQRELANLAAIEKMFQDALSKNSRGTIPHDIPRPSNPYVPSPPSNPYVPSPPAAPPRPPAAPPRLPPVSYQPPVQPAPIGNPKYKGRGKNKGRSLDTLAIELARLGYSL
jgi:hypothetical protein